VTTEDDFQAMLDLDPSDHTTRGVLGDWLCEQGDARGEGYTALAALRLYPADDRIEIADGWTKVVNFPWGWRCETYTMFPRACLPDAWVVAVRMTGAKWVYLYPTRREADDAAALAFALLPYLRRLEPLTPQNNAEAKTP
jgi:uncharacterized protein (TIGR02996 family)